MAKYIPIKGYTKSKVLGFIHHKLLTSDSWRRRALLRLWDFQTNNEKKSNKSLIVNDIGFNKFHANQLSSICKSILFKNELTKYEESLVKRYLPHYSEQIESICDPEKLRVLLNEHYYGNPNYIDSNKFKKYLAKFDKEKYSLSLVKNYVFILTNKNKYKFVFTYSNDKVYVTTSRKTKTLEFDCNESDFREVLLKLVNTFNIDGDNHV